jgi:HTH-type transcriptional regulator, transcriptional repressor of NAD biosynthesis genes
MPAKRFATGLVIGKFYPPHRGHSYLIDVACMHAERVTAIVCDHAEQAIPGRLRAAWLQEMHPEVAVIRIDDVYPSDDSRLWAELTVRWLGCAPGAVFSSEDYGPVYAGLMGSAHVAVDRARTAVPCSGTQVRADPFGWWDVLAPCVRAYFCARIVLIGAESSGKTTLVEALANHYKTVWVPEYGRAYSATKLLGPEPDRWRTEEFVHIAREQCRQEDAAARQANRLLICDTDAFATSIWHERYMYAASEAVEAVAGTHRPDLYVLTDVDIPFVQDGTRDGEHVRPWMHGRFVEVLARDRRPYVVVRGSLQVRFSAAVAAIDATMQSLRRTP